MIILFLAILALGMVLGYLLTDWAISLREQHTMNTVRQECGLKTKPINYSLGIKA